MLINRKLIVLLIIFLFNIECRLFQKKIQQPIFISDYFFHLNEKLPERILKSKSKMAIYANSAQFLTSYEVIIKKIRYTYGVSENGIIQYIDTVDPNFQTSQGFSIFSKFGDLPNSIKEGLRCEPGWAYFLPVDSEWNAAFFIGNGATDRPPIGEDSINFFFQRQFHKGAPLKKMGSFNMKGEDSEYQVLQYDKRDKG